MSEHFHAVVWIDHHEAKVYQFDATSADAATVHSTKPHQHIHHKANTVGSGHAGVDKKYLEQVAISIAHCGAILITGPANAKHELETYLKHAHPVLAKRVMGVQTVDHPTEGELIALGRRFFKASDRMQWQTPEQR